jgi:hypothetical protein
LEEALMIHRLWLMFHSLWVLFPFDRLLAFVAIVFAVLQFIASGKQRRDIKTLASSTSTRYVGMFPNNMADICDVVTKAEKELLIMADYLCYGCYSAPDEFNRLRESVLKAGSRAIILHAPLSARRSIQTLFPEDKFSEEQQKPRFDQFFQRYDLGDTRFTRPTTYKDFVDGLLRFQEETAKEFQLRKVRMTISEETMPFFIWIEDGRDGVFSFNNQVGQQRGFSFRTRDFTLLDNFREYFNRRWDEEAQKSTA